MLSKLKEPSWFGYHTAIIRGKGYCSNLNLHEEKYNQKLKNSSSFRSNTIIMFRHHYYYSP